MYKIVIQFEQKNKAISSLIASEFTNKNTTKFEKMAGSILKDYVHKALNEFSNQVKYNENSKDLTDLDDVLKDLLDDLKNLKETMKDKKKED